MTTPYGVTRGTIYRQLLEATVKYCKKWLREVARTLARADRGMAWTTPPGFHVVHETREPKAQRVATADRTLLVYQEDETQKIDWRKQADGIVAHLVHSLDAAHMMLTIHRLHSAGVRHFAMVHDSFGVHASDIDFLNSALREEFVRIYSEPVLENFLNEQREAHPDVSLPELPPNPETSIFAKSSPLFLSEGVLAGLVFSTAFRNYGCSHESE